MEIKSFFYFAGAWVSVFFAWTLSKMFKGTTKGTSISDDPPPNKESSNVAKEFTNDRYEEEIEKINQARQSKNPAKSTADILKARRRK